MPVPGAHLRMVEPAAEDAQMQHVLRAAERRQADGLRRSLPGGRHGQWRPRRTDRAKRKRRLAEKPDQYYDKIYGIEEVGGTSVLYLSAVPFEQIGLRTNVPQEPLPETTWRVLELLPDVVSTGSVLLGGIWWITNRRAEVARKEGKRK